MAEDKHQATATRERILHAAESLFMEHGYAATSLRVITCKARVNLAAVNYHFGSEEALIREVFERRLGPLNAARIAHLDNMEASARGRPLPVEQIIEAIIAPVLHVTKEPLARGAIFLRLLGRMLRTRRHPARNPAGAIPPGRHPFRASSCQVAARASRPGTDLALAS